MNKKVISCVLVVFTIVLCGNNNIYAKSKYSNVATVAVSGGDYSNPATAMADVTIQLKNKESA